MLFVSDKKNNFWVKMTSFFKRILLLKSKISKEKQKMHALVLSWQARPGQAYSRAQITW